MTALPPDPPLVPFYSLPWVKAAARCGFQIEPIFRQLGIEPDLQQVGQPSISLMQGDQLMELCVAASQRRHFPLALGEAFAFDYLPDLETFLTTSASLRESSRVFEWLRELVNPLMAVQVEESGAQARLILDLTAGEPARQKLPAVHHFAEAIFATTLKFSRALLGGIDAGAFELNFRHDEPPYAAECERVYETRVKFGQKQNALIFDRSLLDRPLEGAFPALHQQAQHLVERRLASLPRDASLSRRVERILTRHHELLGRGIERIAAELKMHPRTLQRRLRDEGQSFAELLSRARYQVAVELLRAAGDDIETISERLGFSDRRSFTRAFTRWAGQSPSRFRRERSRNSERPG
jgi:AraC-like DNA-binding protein